VHGEDLNRVAVLAETLRRGMYEFIRHRRRPVSRDEAAAAVGISRKLAAFHLDKLVDAGLLKAYYARPAGGGGPGAGRPPKLYEPNDDVEVQVSLPERHYDLPGEILLDALETRSSGEEPQAAVERVAYRKGLALGQRSRRSGRSGTASLSIAHVLRSCGFEPYTDSDGALRLNNCPFHRLAQRSPETVCGMNRALIDGVLHGLQAEGRAVLDPRPNECCVAIRGGRETA
jgi:predicted ArsR family transcriptional regulator